jgi:hypothetical protein
LIARPDCHLPIVDTEICAGCQRLVFSDPAGQPVGRVKRSHPRSGALLFHVPASPGLVLPTWATRVIAEHAQTHQRPPQSHGGGNRRARHPALNGYNLAQLATSCIGIGSGAAVQRTAGASPRAEGAAFGPGNWLQRDSSAGRLLRMLSTSSDRPTSLSTQPCM